MHCIPLVIRHGLLCHDHQGFAAFVRRIHCGYVTSCLRYNVSPRTTPISRGEAVFQGHYYCTVYNGSLILGVGSTTIDVRSESDI